MSQQFDVLVIGAGPAGYVCAIRAAQLGMKTACVEEWKTPKGEFVLGGTCLNVGCIPSKAMLESSEHYEAATTKLIDHGITVTGASFDLGKMLARKDAIVAKMTKGIDYLFRKNKVTWLKGHGRLVNKTDDGWQVAIDEATVAARFVIIATGSRARHLPDVTVDQEQVCDNIGALAFKTVPQRLGVIGAGVIGLELGSVWRRLGAKVTVLEALPTFLAVADEAVSKEVWKLFTKDQALDIKLGAKINGVATGKAGVVVDYLHEGKPQRLECDRLVISIGRAPNTENLGVDAVGLKVDAKGFIDVDDHCRTNLPNVYAIGDVVRGPMLAHKGSEEGVMVAEAIAGQKGHVNLNTIPWVIYTSPEIAWVGKTERELKETGVPYRVGIFPFAANGRAQGQDETDGFIKMLAHDKTDEILGVHIVNSHASELIAEAVVAMEFRASAEDIARIVHAHPTLSEVMHEAALGTMGRALHN
ncbi:MAG: dihydrolipoyl dehydrogenase [Burkholderiales bacterium]